MCVSVCLIVTCIKLVYPVLLKRVGSGSQDIILQLISKVASDWSNRLEGAGFGFGIGFCMEGFENSCGIVPRDSVLCVCVSVSVYSYPISR